MRLWSKIFPYRLSVFLQRVQGVLYTLWIKNMFGTVGKSLRIDKPCILQGKGIKKVCIGDSVWIQEHSIIGCWTEYGGKHFQPSISIGNNCNIGANNHISACNRIEIGDGLLTGRFVYIGDNSHGGLSWEESEIPPSKRHLQSKGEIVIGRNVWIGDKVSILGGVTIGDNVIIGAGSIVTHDIPCNCMAAGVPAKIVKKLN